MAKERKKRIFTRLLSGYVTVTLVVLLLTGVVAYALVERYTIRTNLDDLSEKAETLSRMAARKDSRSGLLTPHRIREYEILTGSRIIYIGTDMVARQAPDASEIGKSARDREKAARTPPPAPADEAEQELSRRDMAGSLDEQLVRSILSGTPSTDVRKLDIIGKQVLYAGAPITDEDTEEISGAIIFCRPLTNVGEAVREIFGMLSLSGVAALLCAALLAWFLSKRLTRPLILLNETANRMAEGDYAERFAVTVNDEIGQLGATFNLLSGRLAGVIESLQDEKSKLEQILAGIGEGIVAVDRAGRLLHRNGAVIKLLGASGREEDGLGERQADLLQMLGRAIESGEKQKASWAMPEGVTLELIAYPVTSYDGELIGAVCLVRDISESQRLEQMRRDYIANISHELRTPLTGIRGMAEPLIDGMMDTEEEKQDCYRVIYQETIRLEKLIGEMLDLSRLQDGRVTIETEEMEPNRIVESAVRRLSARAAQGGVTLESEIATPQLRLIGNEDRILQVLIILTDNALSFTSPGGRVTIFARPDEKGVALGVRDTGSGIDPKDLPYIWERFYKADKSRMRTTGTGLGLSIAKLAVEHMHGTIGVETRLGEGSTFTFILPAGSGKDG